MLRQHRKRKGNTMDILKKAVIPIITAAVLFMPLGCATNPVTGQRELSIFMPSLEEQQEIGNAYAPEVKKQLGGPIDNQALQNYINSVGQNVASKSHRPGIGYQFAAVNDDSANAVAVPGGYIYITKGLLEILQKEDQLAAVLAHEVAHVNAEHSAQMIAQQRGMGLILAAVSENTSPTATQVSQFAATMLGLRYSRDFEYQADTIGTDYLFKAGYDPYAMVEVQETLQQQHSSRPLEFFSTHPNPGNRIETIRQHIQAKGYPPVFKKDSGDYQKYVTAALKQKRS